MTTDHVDPHVQAVETERHPLSRQDAEEIAQQVVQSNIQQWKRAARWFLAGFGVFVLMGVGWPEFRYFLLEKAYPPDVFYQRLKESLQKDDELRKAVATDFLKMIGTRVDSGYSKTLYVSPDQKLQKGQNILQFYATPNQRVELTVSAEGPSTARLALLIDNGNPLEGRENPSLPYHVASRDITPYLKFPEVSPLDVEAETQEKSKYIHTLQISPIGLGGQDAASFEILVLVRNERI